LRGCSNLSNSALADGPPSAFSPRHLVARRAGYSHPWSHNRALRRVGLGTCCLNKALHLWVVLRAAGVCRYLLRLREECLSANLRKRDLWGLDVPIGYARCADRLGMSYSRPKRFAPTSATFWLMYQEEASCDALLGSHTQQTIGGIANQQRPVFWIFSFCDVPKSHYRAQDTDCATNK